MGRKDIVVDIETLGKGDCPPVFQIAALSFDIETGEVFSTFDTTCDIKSFNNIEGDTLLWWLNTDNELLTGLVNKSGGSHSEKELISSFICWIEAQAVDNEVYLWGNGVLFDNRIIQSKCKQYEIPYPIFYRNDRDVRTIVELASQICGVSEHDFRNNYSVPDTRLHNAFDDALNELSWIYSAHKIITTPSEERDDYLFRLSHISSQISGLVSPDSK